MHTNILYIFTNFSFIFNAFSHHCATLSHALFILAKSADVTELFVTFPPTLLNNNNNNYKINLPARLKALCDNVIIAAAAAAAAPLSSDYFLTMQKKRKKKLCSSKWKLSLLCYRAHILDTYLILSVAICAYQASS